MNISYKGNYNGSYNIKADIYTKNLIYGLLFYNSGPESVTYIGKGYNGVVYSIKFLNGKELIIKTSTKHYKSIKEIRNIELLTHDKQSPYLCYYYGYTGLENNKYTFVSVNKNLKFTGTLQALPKHVLQHDRSNDKKERFSYFNIIMEKLEISPSIINIFYYHKINTIYLLTFIIGCLKGLRDIFKNKIVHTDVHKIENLGFIKTKNNYYAPKFLDFGQLHIKKILLNESSNQNDWKLPTHMKSDSIKHDFKWGPELLGCVNENSVINMTGYKNKTCDIQKSFAVINSDLYIFFIGIVVVRIFDISSKKTKYMYKNDDIYNSLYDELYTKMNINTEKNKELFNDEEARNTFVKKMIQIILDCIEPDFKVRPLVNDIILKLYKCLQMYFIQDKVDRIYQPIQRSYIESLNAK